MGINGLFPFFDTGSKERITSIEYCTLNKIIGVIIKVWYDTSSILVSNGVTVRCNLYTPQNQHRGKKHYTPQTRTEEKQNCHQENTAKAPADSCG